MSEDKALPLPEGVEIAMNCLAVRARMVSRALSALLERELKQLGGEGAQLKASQLNILAAIGMLGEPQPKDLVWALQLEKSTLSRNLSRLQSRGWIATGSQKGRQSTVRLTDDGVALLREIKPAWERAQAKASGLLGDDQADALTAMGNAMVGVMR